MRFVCINPCMIQEKESYPLHPTYGESYNPLDLGLSYDSDYFNNKYYIKYEFIKGWYRMIEATEDHFIEETQFNRDKKLNILI